VHSQVMIRTCPGNRARPCAADRPHRLPGWAAHPPAIHRWTRDLLVPAWERVLAAYTHELFGLLGGWRSVALEGSSPPEERMRASPSSCYTHRNAG